MKANSINFLSINYGLDIHKISLYIMSHKYNTITSMIKKKMITVIVPVLNEEANISSLISEIMASAQNCPITEIIYIDDGSTDKTLEVLQEIQKTNPILRAISHNIRCGQSQAMWTGIKAAQNNLIVTLDGDGQNDPADIPLLYQTYMRAKDTDHQIMVAGQRRKRQDNFGRRLSSRLANGIRRALLDDGTKDTGCSLKLFNREDYLNLPYFNHMHRYIPALMKRAGVGIAHVEVNHRPRTQGQSKYTNFGRALVGVYDLIGVMWLQKRASQHPTVTEVSPSHLSSQPLKKTANL
jgi:dolichol-phosphate mannosyltransferase